MTESFDYEEFQKFKAREVLKFFEKINEHFVIGEQTMTKEECINTLAEMKENCANGTKYDDPKRWTKAEALRYAIDILSGTPVGSEWEESIQSLNEQMDKLGAHYASSTFCMPDSKKTVSITIWDKDWTDD